MRHLGRIAPAIALVDQLVALDHHDAVGAHARARLLVEVRREQIVLELQKRRAGARGLIERPHPPALGRPGDACRFARRLGKRLAIAGRRHAKQRHERPYGRASSHAANIPRPSGYTNSLRRRCEAMSRMLTVTMMMIMIAEVAW
jgi:hypothetical protein